MAIKIKELNEIFYPDMSGEYNMEAVNDFVYPVDILLEDDTIYFTANDPMDMVKCSVGWFESKLYPIDVRLPDGTTTTVNNKTEMETLKETTKRRREH